VAAQRPGPAEQGVRALYADEQSLTVAVTGPTGEIGKPFLSALERVPEVGRVIGMARRPFDIAAHGWEKVEYRRGDVLDREAVDGLVEEADVVVHLAFVIVAGQEDSREINLRGSRNVFEAAAAAGAKRLVYTSSVAAYGFSRGMPALLTEDEPVKGSARHPYSAHKAEVEAELETALEGSRTEAYVFRPCIVAGPDATLLLDMIPLVALGQRVPGPLRWALGKAPALRPVLPDPGVPFQLVHQDDVAAALSAAVIGSGDPGVYNLAGPGQLTITEMAHELGWHAVPAPRLAVSATAEALALVPYGLPDEAAWIEALRRPVLMDTAKARRRLHWMPHHDARDTLRQMIAAVRAKK
jgi:nucleoside-diphosphate-sugar epimerase